jgi:hypothetical protein
MHAKKTGFAEFLPQGIGLLAFIHDILKIFASESANELADSVAQVAVMIGSIAKRVLEKFRHLASLQSFRPGKEALARFGPQLSFANHVDQDLWRREPVTVRGLQCACNIEADVEPDDVAQP